MFIMLLPMLASPSHYYYDPRVVYSHMASAPGNEEPPEFYYCFDTLCCNEDCIWNVESNGTSHGSAQFNYTIWPTMTPLFILTLMAIEFSTRFSFPWRYWYTKPSNWMYSFHAIADTFCDSITSIPITNLGVRLLSLSLQDAGYLGRRFRDAFGQPKQVAYTRRQVGML